MGYHSNSCLCTFGKILYISYCHYVEVNVNKCSCWQYAQRVTLITIHAEIQASWVVFVAEAPAICATTMYPLPKSLKSFSPLPQFNSCHRAWFDVNCLIVPWRAPVWQNLQLLFLHSFLQDFLLIFLHHQQVVLALLLKLVFKYNMWHYFKLARRT